MAAQPRGHLQNSKERKGRTAKRIGTKTGHRRDAISRSVYSQTLATTILLYKTHKKQRLRDDKEIRRQRGQEDKAASDQRKLCQQHAAHRHSSK